MFRILASLLVLACGAIPASATLTTYTTQSSFNAATTAQSFQNITFPSGSDGTSYTDPTSQVVFSSGNGLTGITAPTGWPTDSSLEISPNASAINILSIVLPSLVTSVSLFVGPQDFSAFNIDITAAGGNSYHNGGEIQTGSVMNPVFFGITSDTAFSTFTITTFANVDHIAIDGVQVGQSQEQAQTPEVATLLMIGSGLLMLRFGRRWMPHSR